jgi:hypothetical protein
MPEPVIGYKLTWSDYTGFVEGHTRLLEHGRKCAALPKTHVETFANKGAAEAAQARLKAEYGDGLVASISRLYLRPPRKPISPLMHLPPAVRRLTR